MGIEATGVTSNWQWRGRASPFMSMHMGLPPVELTP